VQVSVLPVSDKTNDYAAEVARALKDKGLRAELDDSPEKVGAKIRRATMQKVPYMAVIGPREAEARTVAVRHRTQGDLGALGIEAFIDSLQEEIRSKGAKPLAKAEAK
jgi:threonyl-tRNA synthetase